VYLPTWKEFHLYRLLYHRLSSTPLNCSANLQGAKHSVVNNVGVNTSQREMHSLQLIPASHNLEQIVYKLPEKL